MDMHLLEAFTTLRTFLQRYEENGGISPSPATKRLRFLAFADIELIPLMRRLTTVLQQAGIPARDVVELGGESAWFGMFLDDTWTRGVFVQQHDAASMLLTIRRGGDPIIEEHHPLGYQRCTPQAFAAVLERTVEQLLQHPPI